MSNRGNAEGGPPPPNRTPQATRPAEKPTPYAKLRGEDDRGYFERIAAHDRAMNESKDGKPLPDRLRAEKILRLAEAFDPKDIEHGKQVMQEKLREKTADLMQINRSMPEAQAKQAAMNEWLAVTPDLPRDLGAFEGRPELLQWASDYLHMTPRETMAHFEQVARRNAAKGGFTVSDEEMPGWREHTLRNWEYAQEDDLRTTPRRIEVSQNRQDTSNPFNITDDMSQRAAREYGLDTLDEGKQILEEIIRGKMDGDPKRRAHLAKLDALQEVKDREAYYYVHTTNPNEYHVARRRYDMGLPLTPEQELMLDEREINQSRSQGRRKRIEEGDEAYEDSKFAPPGTPLGSDDAYRDPAWFSQRARRISLVRPYHGDDSAGAQKLGERAAQTFEQRGVPIREPHQKYTTLERAARALKRRKLPADILRALPRFLEHANNPQLAAGIINEAAQQVAARNNISIEMAREEVVDAWAKEYTKRYG